MTGMTGMKDYIKQIYPLSYIIRYSNVPRIQNESVAEHSYYVAAIVQKLYDDYDFDLGKALNIAISHDIVEVYINDIPHLIKKRHPELVALLKKIERQEAKNFPKAVEKGLCDLMESDSLESIIVKTADAIQCQQYSMNEIKLGNSGYMVDVLEYSEKRVEELKEKLKKYKRESL